VKPDHEQIMEKIRSKDGTDSHNLQTMEMACIIPIEEVKAHRLSDDCITQIKDGYKNDAWFGPIIKIL
jgi:hypothetical protein